MTENSPHKRNCPQCSRELTYCLEKAMNRANMFNTMCLQCKCRSIEYRKNQSKVQQGIQKGENNPFFGKKHSEETKQNISLARRGLSYLIKPQVFKRNCPICGKEINYHRKYSFHRAIKNNTSCKSCTSEQTRKNRSIAHIGYVMPEEQKKKISESNIGKQSWIRTDEFREKFSNERKGKNVYKRTNEWRIKMRQVKLKELESRGIPPGEDEGAREYIQQLNDQLGYNLIPKRFFEIGYDADGYDSEKHVWFEYDTLYHKRVGQQQKDLIRQNNIINYFISINNPLKAFKRYTVWNNTLKDIILITTT